MRKSSKPSQCRQDAAQSRQDRHDSGILFHHHFPAQDRRDPLYRDPANGFLCGLRRAEGQRGNSGSAGTESRRTGRSSSANCRYVQIVADIPVVLLVGDLRLTSVVRYQIQHGWFIAPFIGDWTNPWKWLLTIPMIVSFIVFTIPLFAQTNRLPFDLPEAEHELARVYNT